MNNAYRMGPPPLPPQPEKKDDESFVELASKFIGALVLLVGIAAFRVALGISTAVILAQVAIDGLHYLHVHAGLTGPSLLIMVAQAVLYIGVFGGVKGALDNREKTAKAARR